MKEIKLTQGKMTLVDDEDFERVNQFKWFAHWNGYNWYASRNIKHNTKRTTISLHREILKIQKKEMIDHRNGNSLDNRKSNLRFATRNQNMHNRKNPQKNNKLGIKGVSWLKKAGKFHAQIKVANKNIHLGLFNVLGDADSAYRKAEEKYFGEFARCNN